MPAHACVQVIPDVLKFSQPGDRFRRTGAPRRCLDLHGADAEPTLEDVARHVNVLDARVGQIRLTAPEHSVRHRHAVLIESESERAIQEIVRHDGKRQRHVRQHRINQVQFPELRGRSRDRLHLRRGDGYEMRIAIGDHHGLWSYVAVTHSARHRVSASGRALQCWHRTG